MKAKVLRAFHHTNTGRTWNEGETFVGSEGAARKLVARGYLAEPEPHAAETGRDGSQGAESDLASLTVKQLSAVCAAENVDVPPKARKADLVAAIEAARKE